MSISIYYCGKLGFTHWLALKSKPVFSGAPLSPSISSIPCSLAMLLKEGYNVFFLAANDLKYLMFVCLCLLT